MLARDGDDVRALELPTLLLEIRDDLHGELWPEITGDERGLEVVPVDVSLAAEFGNE